MHVLRSTYLPTYTSLVRPPYTSDPFPVSSASPSYTPRVTIGRSTTSSTPPLTPSSSSIDIATATHSVQRETQVLDNFIALKVREDVWADDSELHLERDESIKDLFDFMQPRSRLEDLVRHYGVREGVVCVDAPPKSRRGSTPLQFSALSITFSPRSVGLVLMSQGRKRTIVQMARTREEKLEYAAKRLVRELGVWLAGSSSRR
ncbi:hypothetical protein FIBSPDRAFT_853107 [Athelia psychrophila]|uniref:Uncharacterized protein n=1 Tax=Athelia psychrophila TaxID=1759441 RepID=A0A166R5D4_9AGAM|nr:hypothetical protein FIBSPDRAFT_853107 [Fibularhizoctonia sp. CBS 109695]